MNSNNAISICALVETIHPGLHCRTQCLQMVSYTALRKVKFTEVAGGELEEVSSQAKQGRL